MGLYDNATDDTKDNDEVDGKDNADGEEESDGADDGADDGAHDATVKSLSSITLIARSKPRGEMTS